MPAPLGPAIKADIKTELNNNGFLKAKVGSQEFTANFTGAWEMFVEALSNDWAEAWGLWQFGHNAFKGNNIKVISGIGDGTGGSLLETVKLDFIIRWPYRRHPRFLEFEEALVTVLKKEFSIWSSSYKCSKLKYTGTSTHTPLTPGAFNVTNAPTSLKQAGSGDIPNNIRDQVTDILDSKGWRTKHPQCRIRLFLDAIDIVTNKHFAEWLEKTKIIGDTATGPSAPGAGLGKGVSLNTGKLV